MYIIRNFKLSNMNWIHKMFSVIALLLAVSMLYAQSESKDVTIIASGSGKSLEDAKQAALRSATEQAFGAFISSKTEIFNDQVVADQMASISSGNIKSFEVLNQDQLPDGRWGVTLKAILSVEKLTSFVQAKGITVEVKGGMFALNIKQQLLNEQGEIQAVADMVGLLHEPMQISFDYVINSGDPRSLDAESKNWEIPLTVAATCNKNIDFCANYLIKTLGALSLSSAEVETYKSLNKKVFPVTVNYLGKSFDFALRKLPSIYAIWYFTSNWEFYIRQFLVQSGPDQPIIIGKESLPAYDLVVRRIEPFMNHDFNSRKWYGVIDEYDYKSPLIISFLTAGKLAGTYTWNDKRTLSEIEQITGYTVKPRGVVSYFKNGGYLVYEKDGHGLVVALYDIANLGSRDAAVNACEELVINGYDDWYLPSVDELKLIDENVHSRGFGGFRDKTYWSNTVNWSNGVKEYSGAITYRFHPFDVRQSEVGVGRNRLIQVRAVRAY